MNIKEINFSELQIREIGMWPLVLRVGVIALASLITFGILYYFLISSALAGLDAEKLAQAQKRKEYQEKYNLAVNLNAYEEQMVDIQKMYALVLRQLPSDSHIPELIEALTRLAERNNIKITSIKLGDPVTLLKAYCELPIELVLTGSYHSIGKFVSDVAKLSRIVTLENFSLKIVQSKDDKSNNTPLVMNINAKTYWLANAQEIQESEEKEKQDANSKGSKNKNSRNAKPATAPQPPVTGDGALAPKPPVEETP